MFGIGICNGENSDAVCAPNGKTTYGRPSSYARGRRLDTAAPELLHDVRPITGLIEQEEIEVAARDWHGACDAFHRHVANRLQRIRRVIRVHRDPIMCPRGQESIGGISQDRG